MTVSLTDDDLAPSDFLEALTTHTLAGFLAFYGRSPLLLIEVPLGDHELFSGLDSTALAAGGGKSIPPIADPLQYNTVIMPHPQRTATTVPGAERDDPEALLQILGRVRHFGAPLRKREGADAAYVSRISVGRARNKDIVLRHGSVSKFHAWFEMDESGAFRVTDAGSKNATRVNGERLAPREPHAVGPGDAVRFGSVECLVCNPSTLFSAARHAKIAAG